MLCEGAVDPFGMPRKKPGTIYSARLPLSFPSIRSPPSPFGILRHPSASLFIISFIPFIIISVSGSLSIPYRNIFFLPPPKLYRSVEKMSTLAHDQVPSITLGLGLPLLSGGRPMNPSEIGYVQVTDEIRQVESPQVGVAGAEAATEPTPVKADGNAVAGAPQVTGNTNNPTARNATQRNAELISVFIHDLKAHPLADDEDKRRIEALPPGLLASGASKFGTYLLTGFLKIVPRHVAVGRGICPIHSRIESKYMLDLIEWIKDESWDDSKGFFDARLDNKFVKLLLDVNLVWNDNFFREGRVIAPWNESLVLFNPYAKHKLFQHKNCAGCFLRRILSDPRCVLALLTGVEFKIRFNDIPEQNAPALYNLMETAWQILANKYPDLWETLGNPDVARQRVSTDVRALVALAGDYARTDQS